MGGLAEEEVTSEPVSGPEIFLLAGKVQGISSIWGFGGASTTAKNAIKSVR